MENNSQSIDEKILSFDSMGIQECQRNRYPMLFIDRITECVPMKYAKGVKLFSCSEWYFLGHFPDNPVVPGTVLIESLAQVFLMTFLCVDENKGLSAVSNRYGNVRFKRKIVPGEKLDITAELKSFRRGIAIGKAEGRVNGELAVSFDCTIVVTSIFSAFQRGDAEPQKYIEHEVIPDTGLCFDHFGIEKIMKNRAPWLYLDKAVDVKPMESAVGVKNFTYNEWFFPVHFPDDPNVPGFIQVETCLQSFLVTFLSNPDLSGLETADVLIDNVKFQRKVVPGECFVAKARLHKYSRGIAVGTVQSFVNDEPACSLDVTVAIPDILNGFKPKS
jgi:3-hydroxyacyl-[acyl-carrier-protein] dehydratase